MKNQIVVSFFFFFLFGVILAQENELAPAFKDTRIIHTQSAELIQKNKLDVRIAHRFGDIAGDNGGWPNFYGFENVADVAIGVNYGLTNKLNIGLHRSKGSADLKALVTFQAKYQLTKQVQGGTPFTISAFAVSSMSTQPKVEGSLGINAFNKFSHRFAYAGQFLISRRLSSVWSAQLTPSVVHRNIVSFGDVNTTTSLGFALRAQITKVIAVMVDLTVPLNGPQSPFETENLNELDFHLPLGFAVEWDTGGHTFQVSFTNTRGIMETDYIPTTTGNWTEGEFRIGFIISRLFNIK